MILLSYDVNDHVYSINLLKVKIHPTLYGFNQYQRYTDFNMKLDRFILILARIFN